jgi:hypothetical protein
MCRHGVRACEGNVGNDTEVSRRSRGETEEVAREKKTGARFPFHDSVARRTLVCRSAPTSSVPCLAHARVCQPVYRAPRAYASRARPRSCRRARARHSGEMRNAGWKKPNLTSRARSRFCRFQRGGQNVGTVQPTRLFPGRGVRFAIGYVRLRLYTYTRARTRARTGISYTSHLLQLHLLQLHLLQLHFTPTRLPRWCRTRR